MVVFLYIAIYASLLCFVTGCVRRARQYASLPVHLRWELYPVPHEPPHRAKYGGSYFEESEWWTKPRKRYFAGELRVMAGEILLLSSVWKSNRKLWWRSMVFHGGMYCVLAAGAVQAFVAVAARFAMPAWVNSAGGLAGALGRGGLMLMVLGALALLWNRMRDVELRDYTHVADHVHLVAIGVAAGLLLIGSPTEGTTLGSLARGVLRLDTTVQVTPVLAAGVLLSAAVLAYVPYSQMAHFIGKYFGFHAVRWDDAPNHGGELGRDRSRNLAYRPTWSANHLRADGKKNWAEIATENPATQVHR